MRDCITLLTVWIQTTIFTSHALINVTENIRKALDDGNIGCGFFVNLQKVFDTVDHKILLAKLNNYVILGVQNDWFKFYLSNRNL